MAVPARGQRPPDPGDATRTPEDHTRFMAAVVVVAAAALWIPQLTSSFTADETVTHWLVGDGLKRTVERSLEFEGESPFYFIVQHGVKAIFGSSEIALRLPSLLAIIGATILLWRLGRRLVDDDVGLLAGVVLVTMPGIVFAAGDARPYPIAVCGLLASTLLLVRWTESGSRGDGIAYVIVTAATLYMHYFAATALLIHPLYVWRRRGAVGPAAYALAALCVGLLMTPIAPHVLALYRRRETLQVAIPVSIDDYFGVLVPPLLAGTIVFGALIARRWATLRALPPAIAPATEHLAVAWWIVPPTILYLATKLGSTTVFEPRFFFFGLPGLALAGAIALRFLEPERARRILVLAIAVVALAATSTTTHSGENWRAVADLERTLASADTPVLLRPNFIEAAQVDWLTRPEKVGYLFSVLSPYPMRGRITPIPYDLTPAAKAYLEPIIRRTLAPADSFLLINDRGAFRPWLEGRFPNHRTRTIDVGNRVTLVVFSKRPE